MTKNEALSNLCDCRHQPRNRRLNFGGYDHACCARCYGAWCHASGEDPAFIAGHSVHAGYCYDCQSWLVTKTSED